ncbi:MBL fold metallo-hydrolase [Streptomyces sp. XD-27]|uniref:MBL fold metallo-hydrolase n=1 Tax=Streptomyces sp. XD-27 TaxID=3062779 RepID=UPI0026F423C6|nr:MBL fold metallo-hydrolase [Streptomyces sp. XD-27]WKX69780.1 MBL fold metallo-hydrolase [Streptomyces sp. XD-27]
MEITHVTDTVWMLRFPVGQAYAVRIPDGFALVDCGWAGYEKPILDALAGLGASGPTDLREILITHCHKDHYGSAAALAAATGARILAGAADAPVISGAQPLPDPVLADWEIPLYEANAPQVPPAPAVPVDRELSDGDTLDWGEPARILHVPGHTHGSVALHLPDSGVLFTGDTIANVGQLMPGVFNLEPARMADAFRKQAALDVETACFGHGDPLTTGAGAALRAAARTLT